MDVGFFPKNSVMAECLWSTVNAFTECFPTIPFCDNNRLFVGTLGFFKPRSFT